MATTITIQNAIDWAQCFNQFRPLNIGTANQPAITAANQLIQTILSPPFAWNWNRSSVTFMTTPGIQDYVTAAATFGFIEKASWVPAANITSVTVLSNVATYTAALALPAEFSIGALVSVTGCTTTAYNVVQATITAVVGKTFSVALVSGNATEAETAVATNGAQSEISNVINVLGDGNETGQPAQIAPQIDDNAGNITFRLLPLPGQTYLIKVIFQKRIPALVSALAGTWAPIPDHYAVMYQWGFAALMLAYSGNPLWQQFNTKFVSSILGFSEGLSEDQKNIFQTAWLASMSEVAAASLKVQTGNSARSV